MWDVEYTDEFATWWETLDAEEQASVTAAVGLLEEFGPELRFPHSSGLYGARHPHMRELRVQHRGKPYRILYAFDPRRIAVLLIGGGKGGDDRWYDRMIRIADLYYDEHLASLKEEGDDGP